MAVKQYVKRPVTISALQFTGDGGNLQELINFVGPLLARHPEGGWAINTLEGLMKIATNDFVICGIKGEFYPCKPDVFEATYEETE